MSVFVSSQYWYFLMINRFQLKLRNGCHDVKQKSITLDKFLIVTVRRNQNRINFWFMTKSKAVGRIKNLDLSEKRDNCNYEK